MSDVSKRMSAIGCRLRRKRRENTNPLSVVDHETVKSFPTHESNELAKLNSRP